MMEKKPNPIEVIEIESKNCPICDKKEDKFILTGRDNLFKLKGEYNLVKSKVSNLYRVNPRPTANSIGYYYPNSYMPYGINSGIQQSSLIKRLFRTHARKVPKMKPGRMLEIGCASGNYMIKMKNNGWEVEGLEYSETAASDALKRGLNVHVGTAEELEVKGKYDLITAWMVLEHLHEPNKVLEKIKGNLSNNGYFVFSIPNIFSLDFMVFKSSWYNLEIPRHTYLYSPKTITSLLKKNGLEVKKIYHQILFKDFFLSFGIYLKNRGYNNLLTEWLMSNANGNGRLHKFTYPLAFIISSLGLSGRITVWAKKAE